MFQFLGKRALVYGVLAVTVIFFAQPVVFAASQGKGNLVGFVYDQDGTTPVEGAVVMLKNLATGAVFESPKSDGTGAFSLSGIDQGMYIFGVSSPKGDFNAEEVLGIAGNETAKLAVGLNADGDVANPKDQNAPTIAGEKWIGTVVSFDAATNIARVFINKGQLKQDEEFHVKGDKKKYNSDTDFWQKAKVLQQNGLAVKKVPAGQYCNVLLEKPPLDNDFVYVKKSGPLAFFLTPLGLATILAGTTAAVVVIVSGPSDASAVRR